MNNYTEKSNERELNEKNVELGSFVQDLILSTKI